VLAALVLPNKYGWKGLGWADQKIRMKMKGLKKPFSTLGTGLDEEEGGLM
jgi:hypothetical protein